MMLEPGDRPVLGGQWEAAPDGDESGRRWARLAQALGAAVAEFPPGVAAQVRVLRGDDLPDQEAQLLPGAAWNRWIARRGAALVDGDQGAIALDLLTARLSRQAVTEEPAWLAQACSDTARWNDYWEIVGSLRQDAFGPLQDEQRSGRYAMLNALFSHNPNDIARYDRYLTRFLGREPAGISPLAPVYERLFFALLCTLGIPASPRYEPSGYVVVRAGGLSRLPLTDERGEIGLYPVDQLRRALLWIATPGSGDTFMLLQLAALFRPNPAWITAVSQLTDDEFARRQTNNYLESLADAAGAPWVLSGLPRADLDRPATGALRSHDVLGEWAARFTRPFAQQIRLRRDMLRGSAELISVLRGDNPEMRPAIRLALAEAASEHGGLPRLAAVAQQILPIPVADLNSYAVPPLASSEARKFLVQLVEYVDRSGVMGEYLATVGAEWPESELLQRVGAAFNEWDQAHALMLGELMARQG
jgi:hypothetical protein